MEHRYDPSYERDDRDERSRDRDRYRGGRQSQYGQDQYGQGQYGQDPYGQSDYGSGSSQYSGFERSRDRDRWGEQRDYRGESSRFGGGYGSQSGYGSQQRFGGGESRFGDEQRWRGESQGFFGDRDREGWRGGRFGYGERGRDRPGFFQRLFKRGPKGYQRSDERLREDISERLMYAMEIDSSEVTITATDGRVTLDGTVPDRFMKHAIEDMVDECPGVQDIDNRIRVQREGASSQSGTGLGTGSTASTGSQSRRPS